MAGDAAILEAPLPLPVHLGDCWALFAIGRRLTMPLCFSEFITAGPCRVRVAEGVCGGRTISFLVVILHSIALNTAT